MHLLIDGNNLLHASDVFPEGGDRSLAAAQLALLQVLRDGLNSRQAAEACIVFDGPSAGPPERFAPLQIVHPRRGQDADQLLERLILQAQEPKRLLVVSSDHRIQRAARQSGARWIDSEIYWSNWKQQRRLAAEESPCSQATKEKPEPDAADVQMWLDEFRNDQD